MRKLFLLIVQLMIAIGLSEYSMAASFDCRKATIPSDVAVCANAALSAKDDELGQIYRQRRPELEARGADLHSFTVEASRWLSLRLVCKADLSCLNKWYDERLAELKTNGAPNEASSDPLFLQGWADRNNWEKWFANLSGDYRAGAEYWATHRSETVPPSCKASPPSINLSWTLGCVAAALRLADSDLRRKSEPTYRLGWNSLAEAATSPGGTQPTKVPEGVPARFAALPDAPTQPGATDWRNAISKLIENGWFYAGESKNSQLVDFYNYKVITLADRTLLVTRRHEFATPQEHSDLSLIGSFAIDCTGRRLRLVSETDFAGRNLSGNITFSKTYANSAWYYPDPGSGDDSLMSYGCDGELFASNEQWETRAGDRFSEILKSNGISGVRVEIGDCYDRSRNQHNRADLIYCVALDEAAGILERSIERTEHFPTLDFFGEDQTEYRVRYNLNLSGITGRAVQTTFEKIVVSPALKSIDTHFPASSATIGNPSGTPSSPTDSGPPTSSYLVHMQDQGGTYVVPVQINGAITLKFVIDSGASDVTIPADVFLTLVRAGTIAETDLLGKKTYVLANGATAPSQTFVIRSLKIGDAMLANVTGTVAPVEGTLLLGQSFLSRFKSWSINNQKGVLILQR